MGGAGGRFQTNIFADLRDKIAVMGNDNSGDLKMQGDLINRLWVSMFYAMGINRADYEVSRGGGVATLSLTNGYGHVLPKVTNYRKPFRDYPMTKLGDPWEFLLKTGTIWS